MFAITLLVLTALIGILAIILLPIAVLLEWTYNYTITSIETESTDLSIAMGYNIFTEYVEFFYLRLPYLYFYFTVNNISIINVNIKFFPPNVERVIVTEENPEQSSLNLVFPENQVFNSQDNSYDANNNIQNLETGNNFSESVISLKTSSSSPIDPYTPVGIIDTFISGMDDAFGFWTFTVSAAVLLMTTNTFMSMPLMLALLIIPIFVFITCIILSLTIKQFTKYETFIYLIGASIVSLFTSLMIYKKGKPKPYNQSANQEYFIEMMAINTYKEALKDIGLDISGVIIDYIFENEPVSKLEWSDLLNLVFDGALAAFSCKDWYHSLQLLEYASVVVPNYNSNWKDDILLLTGFSLLVTAALTIWAFGLLDVLPNANFVANTTNITQGESIYFTYTGSEKCNPQTYSWDFGDGTTSTEKNPTYIYKTTGSFTISVTVIDREGDFDIQTKTDYIMVN